MSGDLEAGPKVKSSLGVRPLDWIPVLSISPNYSVSSLNFTIRESRASNSGMKENSTYSSFLSSGERAVVACVY